MESFSQFQQLPSDMRTKILSTYPEILVKTPRIGKSIQTITQQKRYEQICNLPISKQELTKYMEDVPDLINIFVWDYTTVGDKTDFKIEVYPNNIIKLIILKFILVDAEYIVYDTYNYAPGYNFGKEIIEVYDNRVIDTTRYDHRNNEYGIEIPTIINLALAYDYDLITKYHIYYARGCDNIKPEFSKNKILQELSTRYNNIDKNDILSLISINSYMIINAQRMGIRSGKRLIGKIDIQVNDDLQIIEVTDNYSEIDPEEFIDKCNEVNDELYNKLTIAINKLS